MAILERPSHWKGVVKMWVFHPTTGVKDPEFIVVVKELDANLFLSLQKTRINSPGLILK
jgi:hypothetical protein